jgi:hypothetical protein
MDFPRVGSGVEQRGNLTGIRVNPGEVRALAEIAALTTSREVFRVRGALMLPGDDMVKVEGPERQMVLVEAALLTALSRSLPNDMAQAARHQAAAWPAR